MPSVSVIQEAVSFTPTALIELWTLDGTAVGLDTVYYFVNGSSSSYQSVIYDNVSYVPFPIKVEGMEMDGKGSLPRPKLTVSNINGFVSNLLLNNERSLDGATVTRTRVNARFLDASNFGTPEPAWLTPDVNAHWAPEPFVINRKMAENPNIVQWELCSPLEMQRARLPKHIFMANVCIWKYRQGGTCGYSGVPVADAANRTFTGSYYNMTLVDQGEYLSTTTYNRGDYVQLYSTLPLLASIPTVWVCTTNGTVGVNPSKTTSKWVADACNKTVAACKLHFPTTPLRTSAFPGVARAGWIAQAA